MNNFGLTKTPFRRPCHALNPGLTRLADPNRVRDARPYIYWDSLPENFFFFLKPNWYLWVWPTSYNRIKILNTNQKNYHRSGVHQNLYPYNRVPLTYTKLYFSIYQSEHGPTCSEPIQVCWPCYMRKSSDVFSCTYTDEKPVLSFTLSGKHFL